MKINKFLVGLAGSLALTGCLKSKDITYPDFEYQTTYFASQFPIRTVELGEDLFVDNSLDNQHKVLVTAITGGVRENKKDIVLNFSVDPSLCDRLYYPVANGGRKILPLPANYYQLASNQIIIPKGSLMGGVEVQLTDAFFQDPLAIDNNYALPLLLSNAKGADSILRGQPTLGITNPRRTFGNDWIVQPKDYVVYTIKYVNPWHGNYLRRGVDIMTAGGNSRTVTRHATYVESDEVNKLTTKSLDQVELPLLFKDDQGRNFSCNLLLTFDNTGKCTVSTSSNPSLFTVTGTGAFVKKGEKNSWGNKDRDALYLSYQVTYDGVTVGTGSNTALISGSIATKDTLVVRDRAVTLEKFVADYK